MILITFSNNETLEFSNRITATLFLVLHSTGEFFAVKLRCERPSDFMVIQNYIELLKLNIQST